MDRETTKSGGGGGGDAESELRRRAAGGGGSGGVRSPASVGEANNKATPRGAEAKRRAASESGRLSGEVDGERS